MDADAPKLHLIYYSISHLLLKYLINLLYLFVFLLICLFTLFICFFTLSGLVCYKPILDLILHSDAIRDNGKGLHLRKTDNNGKNDISFKTKGTENNRKREESVKIDENNEKEAKMAPVLAILAIVRKSLRKFITSVEDFREAKSVMLKVFRSFDPQEKNKLSTRDFCLAVSVLINEIRKNDDKEKEDKNGNILHGNNRELNGRNSVSGNVLGRNGSSGNIPGNVLGRSVSGNVLRNNASLTSKQMNITISEASSKNILNHSNSSKNVLPNGRRKSITDGNNNNNSNNNLNYNDNAIGNDVPILSKQDWTNIYHYFESNPNKADQNMNSSRKPFTEITVDYLKFCDSVLNYEEIKKLVYLTVSTDGRGSAGGQRGSAGDGFGGNDRGEREWRR